MKNRKQRRKNNSKIINKYLKGCLVNREKNRSRIIEKNLRIF